MQLSTSYSSWKYDAESLKTRVEAITLAVEGLELRSLVLHFDAVVLTGSSGTWLGGALACSLSVPLVLCRKTGEGSHGPLFEGSQRAQKLLLVDDFVASGDTARRVAEQWRQYTSSLIGDYMLVGVLEHSQLVQEGSPDVIKEGRLHIRSEVNGMPVVGRLTY